jgi:uncharacterized protein YodC (DUF2158 family)
MAPFKQGDVVRAKGGDAPNMTVDGYTNSGEVICTYWIKDSRKQEHFIEATLERCSPEEMKQKVGAMWLGKERH